MIDRLQRYPNQNLEQRPNECCLETVCDIWGNIQDQPFDPGFSLAATFKVMKLAPNSGGTDPYAALLSVLIYGALPTEKEPFDATTTSELYESSWDNYTPEVKHVASLFPARGVASLMSSGEIDDYLTTDKQGVALTMRWYESFNTPLQDGTLPPPEGNSSNHCVAVYGYDQRGFQIKPWLGPGFGDHGYAYLPLSLFPSVFLSGYAFDAFAWRWFSLAYVGATHPWLIPDVYPQLIGSK